MLSKSTGVWVEVFIWASPSSNTGQDTDCLHRYLIVFPSFEEENKGAIPLSFIDKNEHEEESARTAQ